MSPTRATLTLALGTALVLPSLPAEAQRARGGGMRHGGSGYHGGGGRYAVPRGGPGYRPPVGAAGRHPRPGDGYHSGYRGGYYGGYYGHGHHGHGHYGHGYRPYYGYGYYPYPYYGYYPYGFSFSFGWPSYGGYWPYAAPAYAPAYSEGAPYAYAAPDYRSEAPPPSSRERGRYGEDRDVGKTSEWDESGRLRLEVKPDDAAVYVDGDFWAQAREARMLWLRAGLHTVEVVHPGFPSERREVEVVKGATAVLRLELPPK